MVRSGSLSWSASGRSHEEAGGTGVESATLTIVKELDAFAPSKVMLSLLSDTVQLESPVFLNLMRWLSGKVPVSLKETNSSSMKGSSWTEDELGWFSSISFRYFFKASLPRDSSSTLGSSFKRETNFLASSGFSERKSFSCFEEFRPVRGSDLVRRVWQ